MNEYTYVNIYVCLCIKFLFMSMYVCIKFPKGEFYYVIKNEYTYVIKNEYTYANMMEYVCIIYISTPII